VSHIEYLVTILKTRWQQLHTWVGIITKERTDRVMKQ